MTEIGWWLDRQVWRTSRFASQADLAHPRCRYGPTRRFFGEVPGVQGLFAGPPGEERPAIVDEGGKTDAADFGIEQRQTQVLDLGVRFFQVSLGGGDFLLEAVPALAFRSE